MRKRSHRGLDFKWCLAEEWQILRRAFNLEKIRFELEFSQRGTNNEKLVNSDESKIAG